MKRSLLNTWGDLLNPEFEKPYIQKLREKLLECKKEKRIIYPPTDKWFNAFNFTEFENVRCVILGQDPYHQESQAHGLAFSVPQHVSIPPSLRNIFKELKSDLKIDSQTHGCLENWSKEGVLLLNSVLTVEQGLPASHANWGWEKFTNHAIKTLSQKRKGIVFVLWGRYARSKKNIIDCQAHHILESAHPSPLSAHRGFFGSRPFSKINYFLNEPIHWAI